MGNFYRRDTDTYFANKDSQPMAKKAIAKYKDCKTCGGYGLVTMIGQFKKSIMPSYEYEFSAPCADCENGTTNKNYLGWPDSTQMAVMGYRRKHGQEN